MKQLLISSFHNLTLDSILQNFDDEDMIPTKEVVEIKLPEIEVNVDNHVNLQSAPPLNHCNGAPDHNGLKIEGIIKLCLLIAQATLHCLWTYLISQMDLLIIMTSDDNDLR